MVASFQLAGSGTPPFIITHQLQAGGSCVTVAVNIKAPSKLMIVISSEGAFNFLNFLDFRLDLLLGLLPVYVAPDAQRIIVFQLRREYVIRKVLVAYRAAETVNSSGTNRSATGIGSSWERTTVNHRSANFYSRRETVNQ